MNNKKELARKASAQVLDHPIGLGNNKIAPKNVIIKRNKKPTKIKDIISKAIEQSKFGKKVVKKLVEKAKENPRPKVELTLLDKVDAVLASQDYIEYFSIATFGKQEMLAIVTESNFITLDQLVTIELQTGSYLSVIMTEEMQEGDQRQVVIFYTNTEEIEQKRIAKFDEEMSSFYKAVKNVRGGATLTE